MASGSFSGSGNYVNLKISWSSTKIDRGSTVKATLYAVNNNYAYFQATVNQGYSVTINGTKKSGDDAKLSSTANGTATLISNSVDVKYTGDKSITISGAANLSNVYCNGSALGSRSVSKTVALDKVGEKPPVPTVSKPTKSTVDEIKTTSITIEWARSDDYNDKATYTVQVSKDGGSFTTIKSGITNATTSYKYSITPKQGATYQFRVKAVNDIGSSSYSTSGVVTINKVNAPTIGDIATYNPYVDDLTISHTGGSQTNGGSFSRYCHIYYDYGGSSQKYIGACNVPTNTTTTLTMTADDVVKSNILSVLGTTTCNSSNFYAVCWNQNGNESRSVAVKKKFTIDINTDGGAAPTLEPPTLSGGYSNYDSSCFIIGKYDVEVTSGSAFANRFHEDINPTLTYKISFTDAITDISASSATFTGLTAGKKTITVTVTDSRGLSTSETVYCRYQAWTKPTVKIISAERDNDTPTTVNIEYEANPCDIYTYRDGVDIPGEQINSIVVKEYTTNTTYADCSNLSNSFSISGISTESSYNIKVRVGDIFAVDESDYEYAAKDVGSTKVYISTRKHGIGLNCIPDSNYRLQVGGDVKIGGTLKTEFAGNILGHTRFNDDWIGMYPTNLDAVENTNRKGWIGHNDTNDLHIKNEKNGYIKFVTAGKVLGIAADSNGYVGFSGEGGYVRTPTNGLLPNASASNSTIGTADWKFANGYFADLNVKGKSLIDLIYPVGTTYITKTNSNPSTLFGGTWELYDKMFQEKNFTASSGTTYFTPTSKISAYNIYAVRKDSSVKVRLYFTVAAALDDSEVQLGKFNWSALGFDSILHSLIQITSVGDDGNGIAYTTVSADGTFSSVDVIAKSTTTIVSGSKLYLNFTVPIPTDNMLDSACDRFFWRRTA